MRKLVLLFLGILIASSVWGINYGDYVPSSPSANGIAFSPKDFTVAVLSPTTWEAAASNKLTLTSGTTDITTFTTEEVVRVWVIPNRTSEARSIPARVYSPEWNEFRYSQPTLEVIGATFGPNESFRVEFLDRSSSSTVVVTNEVSVSLAGYASFEAFSKRGFTTSPTTLTFYGVSKSFVVTNYDTTNVLLVNLGSSATLEVDPAIGSSRMFPYTVSSIIIKTISGTASGEVEVRL